MELSDTAEGGSCQQETAFTRFVSSLAQPYSLLAFLAENKRMGYAVMDITTKMKT